MINRVEYDLLLADPPYGINLATNYSERRAFDDSWGSHGIYPKVHGDNRPFDPKPFVDVPSALWGANYYSDKLEVSSGWLVWDKQKPDTLDQSTCELAWTNCVKGVRRFKYLWNGAMRHGYEQLYHPTQKPIALMSWCLSLRWTKDFKRIFDPFLGSGPVLVACIQLGREGVGVEIEEGYCEIAAQRCDEAFKLRDRQRANDVDKLRVQRVMQNRGKQLGIKKRN